jgi:hypothetical protein
VFIETNNANDAVREVNGNYIKLDKLHYTRMWQRNGKKCLKILTMNNRMSTRRHPRLGQDLVGGLGTGHSCLGLEEARDYLFDYSWQRIVLFWRGCNEKTDCSNDCFIDRASRLCRVAGGVV